MTKDEAEGTNATVEGLCGLARDLGYHDPTRQLANRDGTCVGDLLYFLEDNPGACEALVQWVLDEGRHADGSELEDAEEDGTEED